MTVQQPEFFCAFNVWTLGMRTALTEQSSAWATPGAPASLPAKAQLPRAGRDAGAPGTYPVEPVCCSPSHRFISTAKSQREKAEAEKWGGGVKDRTIFYLPFFCQIILPLFRIPSLSGEQRL